MKLSSIEFWEKNDPRWSSVWQSKEFQVLLEGDNWFTRSTLPLISNQVLGWYHPKDNERFYFSAWLLNSLQIRKYNNDLIHDLYVMHEALHAATIDQYMEKTSDAFVALRVNEIEVSLETEAWVYLREPSWIGKTFSPLWINDPATHLQLQTKIKDLPGIWEKDYRTLVEALPFPERGPIYHNNILFTEKNVYLARRAASFFPQSESGQMVKKYEDLSVKWLNKILHGVEEVQQGRMLLKQGDIDVFLKHLERNRKGDALPFADLQLKQKKIRHGVQDAPQFLEAFR